MAYAHANFEPKHQGEYLDILRRCTETEERRLALDEEKELRLRAKAGLDEDMAEFKKAKEKRLAMQAELEKERDAVRKAKEERLGVQAELDIERATLAQVREQRLRDRWNRISGNIPPDEIRTATSRDYRAHITALRDQQGGLCPLCEEALPDDDTRVHLDHVTPLREDGEISVKNLQAVHAACNLAKG